MKVPADRKRDKYGGRKGERRDETEERENDLAADKSNAARRGLALQFADDDFGFIKAGYVESLRCISSVTSINNNYRDKRARRSFRSAECRDRKRIGMRRNFRRAIISGMPTC